MSVRDLEDEITTLAAHIYAGTCRWLDLVAELDRRGDWDESGCGSCAAWLSWRCALLPRAAREHVRVARRLRELPVIHAAFASGELSFAKVRALTRVAEAETEEALLELARELTAAQLERALRAYRRVTAAEANDLQANAHLVYSWDEDGSLIIRAQLAPEDGALFLRALEQARDGLNGHVEGGSAEPRRPTNAEALVAMADSALASRDGRSGGDRYQVVVHVDEDNTVLEDGPSLARETAERLACDASLVTNGRKTRSIPPSLRRALTRRDRGCRFPGCENHRFVDGHHIRHWAHGGATTIDNLVLLCRRHHRLVHEGGYRIDPQLRFYDPWGQPIAPVRRAARGDPDVLARDGPAIDARTCASGEGWPVDLGDAVEGVLVAVGAL